ncbi:MAG: alanine--glyoxylate aminotransferase family protein [Anaerolineales bacterium]|nr:alanine--glyoxylate aminotransferase family protein [Anaerolineales bacterium]
MDELVFDRQISAIPGATSLHPAVLRAMQRPYVNPWSSEFLAVYDETLNLLQKVYQTQNDVLVMMGPIRLAMDAVVCSLLEPGERQAVVAVNGHWSELFTYMIRAHGGESLVIEQEWGQPVDPDRVRQQLDLAPPGQIKALFVTHVETSTGVVNPVRELGEIARERDLLIVVDAAQTLGGAEVCVDDWGIDFCISGSHKCVSAPAGLSFIAISRRGWKALERRKTPIGGWYTNLLVWRRVWMERESGYFTFPASLLFGLRAALKLITGRPLPELYRQYALVAVVIRRSMLEMGLKLVPMCGGCSGCDAPGRVCADTVTAIRFPPGVDHQRFSQFIHDRYRISIAGTYGPLAGKAFRVGPAGLLQLDPGITIHLIGSIGLALRMLGFPARLDQSLEIANSIFSGAPGVLED